MTARAGDHEMCGCGEAAALARTVHNRPALSEVDYRVGNYATFRESLLAGIGTRAPGLRTSDLDDFTVALLDGCAVLCDIVTFYTERLAQESYLRTAAEPGSLRELGALVGHKPHPGAAAKTWLAFRVEPPPAPLPESSLATIADPIQRPAAQPEQPVLIAAGTQVRAGSAPGGAMPATFETVEPITAKSTWNTLRATRTKPGIAARFLRLGSLATGIRPGDTLLFEQVSWSPVPLPGGGPSHVQPPSRNLVGGLQMWTSEPELRRVSTVQTYPLLNETELAWDTDVVANRVHIMRKRLTIFGHNAPRPSRTSPGASRNLQISPVADAADLEGSHPEIKVGSWMVLIAGRHEHHFRVANVAELSRAAYGISGRVTRVGLEIPQSQRNRWQRLRKRGRAITVLAVPEPLTPAPVPDRSAVTGPSFEVDGVAADLAGRTVIVAGSRGTQAVLVSNASVSGERTTLTVFPPVSGAHDRRSFVVYGNAARATHGETVRQILGDGAATRPFAEFELRHAPLTYVASDQMASGITSTLRVSVNGVRWHEKETLFGATPQEPSFTTGVSGAGAVVVRFGDGVRGARTPTGAHNLLAEYRKGTGTAGILDAGVLTQLTSPPPGVTGVVNPVPATGGQDGETVAMARQTIGTRTRTLGRAVSISDYADLARSFRGIAKAQAVAVTGTILLTVTGPGGTPVPSGTIEGLVTMLRQHGDPQARLQARNGRISELTFQAQVKVHPDHSQAVVFAAISQALIRGYEFEAREFGQGVPNSELTAVIQRIAGVAAVNVAGVPVGSGIAYPAGMLVLRQDPRPWMEVMR